MTSILGISFFVFEILLCGITQISLAESQDPPSIPTYKMEQLSSSSSPEKQEMDTPIQEGAVAHSYLEVITVTGNPMRIKRSQAKNFREDISGYISATPLEVNAYTGLHLSFVSGDFIPQPGIDPQLINKISQGESFKGKSIYCFLLMNEYLSQETENELKRLGVVILGPHSDAYKVKVPANIPALETILALPYVEWIGYSQPEQKIDPDLLQSLNLAKTSNKEVELPVIINLFDAETSDNAFKHQLEEAGVKVGDYDAELFAYTAFASSSVIDQITSFDFVLFIEPVRIDTPSHNESMALIGIDYIRGGNVNFDADSIPVGIMDTGFMVGSAAETMHQDLNKN